MVVIGLREKLQICFGVVICINACLNPQPQSIEAKQTFLQNHLDLCNTERMKAEIEAGEVSKPSRGRAINRGVSVLDLILRIVACLGTLGSAIAMGTSRQTLPFFTRFVRFRAVYKDLPSFTLFVIANSVVCAYLALSLPLSTFHIIKSAAKNTRIMLLIFDTVMMALLTAGASAASAIVRLAHNGSSITNWFAICQQFNNFCQRISGSLIGSFVGIVVFILLIIIASVAISRR